MTNLEMVIGSFYGAAKTTHIFQNIQVHALIALMKTNKYFHQYKKLFYKLIISKLRIFDHKYIPNYNKYFYNHKRLMRKDMILRVFECIQQNAYLKHNPCLVKTYKKALSFDGNRM